MIMAEVMGIKGLCQSVDSGAKLALSPTGSGQDDNVQSNKKGARKRKGKPVKIYQDEYQQDVYHQDEYHKDTSNEKGYQEDEQEAYDKKMFIGRVCKRKLLIRMPMRSKVPGKSEMDDTGGTDEDSIGSESHNEIGRVKVEEEEDSLGSGSHDELGRAKAEEDKDSQGSEYHDDPDGVREEEGDDSGSEPRAVVRKLRSRTMSVPVKKSGKSSGAARREYRRSRPYQHCPTCEYKTRDKDTFKSHLAKHDPSAERFTCEICSKTFRNKRSFQWHLRVHRTPEQLHRCRLCSYRTPQRSIWLRHINEVHKVDSEGNHLNDDAKCGECSFACVTEYRLKMHVKAKHCEKQHKCPECDYSAISKCDIEKHVVNRHLNERRHLCSECGYMAKTVSALNDHARGHRGLKAFVCDTCGKAYARGDKLKIHMRTHSEDQKPYICPYCMHACSRKDHLQVHLKRVHKKILENENDQPQAASTKASIEPATGNC